MKEFEPTHFQVGERQEMIAPGANFKLISETRMEVSGENGEIFAIESDTPLNFSFKSA